VARSGQVGSAITSVIGDHAVTMTIAFIPLPVVETGIKNFQLFWVSLAFALMPALYAGFIHFGARDEEHGFRRWHLFGFGAAYLAYVALVLLWIQPSAIGSGGSG
jgi:cation:H+ antiporter